MCTNNQSDFENILKEVWKMRPADDLKKLGEDIVASYDARIRDVGQLAKDTHEMLKGFKRDHKERASNLRADLAKGEANRIKVFEGMLEETQRAINDIEIDVKKKLKEVSSLHGSWKAVAATMAMRRRGHSVPFGAKGSKKVTTGKEVFGENKPYKKVAKGKRQTKKRKG